MGSRPIGGIRQAESNILKSEPRHSSVGRAFDCSGHLILEWSLVQFQVARLFVLMSEWSKEMDLSPIGRLSAQVRILLGTSRSRHLE
jgi:hypothetical protein